MVDALFLGLAIMAGSACSSTPTIAQERSAAALEMTPVFRQAVASHASVLSQPVWRQHTLVPEPLRQPTFRPRHVKSPTLRAAVAGAAMGLFAGAAIGYVMTNRSGCDTCALQGLFLGAPIGSGVGAVLGMHWKK